MTIKVLCECGQKFAFDVEPVNGRMPGTVQCPACGADGTAAANANIASQIGTASPKATPAPVAVLNVPAAAPAAAPSVRIAGGAEAAPSVSISASPKAPSADADVPAFEACHRHTQSPAAANCVVCNKGICLDCMEQFGYLCSVWCKEQAAKKNIHVPVYARQKTTVAASEDQKANKLIMSTGIAAVVLIALSVWYNFFLSKPKVAFALAAAPSAPFIYSDWAGEDKIIALTSEKIALHDISSGKVLWETPFKPDEKPQQRVRSLFRGEGEEEEDEDFFFFNETQATINGQNVWVFFPQRAVRFNLSSGKREQEVTLPQPADEMHVGQAAFLAIGERTPMAKVVSKIDLDSGRLQSTVVTQAMQRPYAPAPRTVSTAFAPGTDLSDRTPNLFEPRREIFLSDSSVVHLQSRVLEVKFTQVQTMKERKGPGVLDSSNVRASQGWEAAEEFMSDMRRQETGGVRYENESRYAVTIRRLLGPGRSWTGEVVGQPTLYALRGLDLLIAGKGVYAFDKTGQKIWESKLSYPVAPRFQEGTEAPAFEHGGKVYIYDQGTLTCFEARSGEVKWRYQTVGVSGMCADAKGKLYVCSTTAGPDNIKYSDDISLSDQIHPMILKMDPATGTVHWQAPRVGESAFVSGKFLYATRGQISRVDMMSSLMNGGDGGAPMHHRVHRIDPGNGKEEWEYYRSQAPHYIAPRGNRILLRYPKEIEVLKFFSL